MSIHPTLDCRNTKPSLLHGFRARTKTQHQGIPMPVTLESSNLRAADVFEEDALASHLDRNAGWLQARPRTSNQIEEAIFHAHVHGAMELEAARLLLNWALWDAEYSPDDSDSSNPTWLWLEGSYLTNTTRKVHCPQCGCRR